MITIPLYSLLVIYAVFLIVFVIFFAINFFHIILTGTTSFSSFLVTLFVTAFFALIIFGTWYLLQSTDWTQQITIWNSSWLGGLPGQTQI